MGVIVQLGASLRARGIMPRNNDASVLIKVCVMLLKIGELNGRHYVLIVKANSS
jgi:hypothetical protein